MENRNRTIRNLIIFSIVAVGGGFLGIFLNRATAPANPMEGLGTLVWLVSPLLANILLRTFGGDGWKDSGLGLHLKTSWMWYLITPFIIIVASLIPLGLGTAFGAVSAAGLSQQGLDVFLPLVVAGFVGAMVKNIFEEFAWRGYLTPRFASLGLHPFANAVLTGFVWAGWHVPYYLYFLDQAVLKEHTPLGLPVFIVMVFLIMPFDALVYGELRLVSKSVWPAWLLHNFANAISLTLFTNGFVTLSQSFSGVVFSPGSEGIVYALIMGAIGFGLYRYRKSKENTDSVTP